MLSFTIHQALTGNIEAKEHYLYLYRDEEVIFYIGRSLFPLERLREHLGLGAFDCCPSLLGRLILKNLPGALSWTVELWTISDSDGLIRQYRPEYDDWYQEQRKKRLAHEALAVAEEVLIEHFHPCLNVAGNRRGKLLPERYQRKSEVHQSLAWLQMIIEAG